MSDRVSERPSAPTCRMCCAVRSGPAAPAWSWEREADGRERWLCPDCTRRHARDIEARLAPEWW